MRLNNAKLDLFACAPVCFCRTTGLENDKLDYLDDVLKIRRLRHIKIRLRTIHESLINENGCMISYIGLVGIQQFLC